MPDFIKIKRADIFWYLMRDLSISWLIWLLIIVGVAMVVAGVFVDFRISLVGLILCLSIVPSMAFFMYYSRLLGTNIIVNVLPHTVESCPGGYKVTIYRKQLLEKEDSGMETEWVVAEVMAVFEENVVSRERRGAFMVLHLVDSPVRVLYVPKDLKPEPAACASGVKIIRDENP